MGILAWMGRLGTFILLAFSLYHDINVINSEIILGIFTCDGGLMMSKTSIAPCSLAIDPVQVVMPAVTR